MGDAARVQELRKTVRLPSLRLELWHGFIFLNLDPHAAPLGPSLAKLEPLWAGYEATGLKALPPVMSDKPLPWNWKVHVENFTDAYHTEYVHIGTHDFAPSAIGNDGVRYTEMSLDDNAIVRSVPLRQPDGGMMKDGWGENAAFPAIATLPPEQRSRLTFAMLPPSLTLMFAPGTVAYTLIRPTGVDATLAGSDRVTYGGWLLPQSTLDLPDLQARCAAVSEGGSKIWAQDVPMNLGMQASKRSRFTPHGIYGPLEGTLPQFNLWLLNAYRRAMAG
jgi:phenylpropionate dioxygenase-like ring-hydroxylating dioxygenase large terminal subunit